MGVTVTVFFTAIKNMLVLAGNINEAVIPCHWQNGALPRLYD